MGSRLCGNKGGEGRICCWVGGIPSPQSSPRMGEEVRGDGFPLSRENGGVMREEERRWIPAFAGMTRGVCGSAGVGGSIMKVRIFGKG